MNISRLITVAATAIVLVSGVTAFAQAGGVDIFAGGGPASDPWDDDLTGQGTFGVAYRYRPWLSVGGEFYYTKLTNPGRRGLISAYAKYYAQPKWAVRPFASAGFGFANLDFDSDRHSCADCFSYDSKFEFIPRLSVGLELGWKEASVLFEISTRHMVTQGGESSDDRTIAAAMLGIAVYIGD